MTCSPISGLEAQSKVYATLPSDLKIQLEIGMTCLFTCYQPQNTIMNCSDLFLLSVFKIQLETGQLVHWLSALETYFIIFCLIFLFKFFVFHCVYAHVCACMCLYVCLSVHVPVFILLFDKMSSHVAKHVAHTHDPPAPVSQVLKPIRTRIKVRQEWLQSQC